MLRLWPRCRCETGSKTQTLERLVEDKYHVQRLELLACNRQGQADKDGMEDDAEFEDEDGRHLRSIVLDVLPAVAHIVAFFEGVIMLGMVTVVAQVVFAWCVRGRANTSFAVKLGSRGTWAFQLVSIRRVVVENGEAHGHELGEEEDKDGHEGDAFDPGVVGDGAGQAFVPEGFVGRGEEVDEGSRYDDTGPEIFGNEEGPSRNTDSSVTGSVDGEQGACEREHVLSAGSSLMDSNQSTYRTKSPPR